MAIQANPLALNTYRTFVHKRAMALNVAYCILMDGLQENLAELDIKGVSVFKNETELMPLRIFLEWEAGHKSATEVFYHMTKMEYPEVAKNKLFRTTKRIKKATHDVSVHQLVDSVEHTLNADVLPLYVEFLRRAESLFDGLKRMDETQPPVLYARFKGIADPKDPKGITTKDVTPDQVYKLVESLGLSGHEAYLCNDFMLIFELRDSSQMKHVHWFLSDMATIDTIRKDMGIYRSKNFSTREAWFLSLSQQLGLRGLV